jgi:hypothetical protein
MSEDLILRPIDNSQSFLNKKERHLTKKEILTQSEIGVKRKVGEGSEHCYVKEKYLCHLLGYDYSSLKKLVAICATYISSSDTILNFFKCFQPQKTIIRSWIQKHQ